MRTGGNIGMIIDVSCPVCGQRMMAVEHDSDGTLNETRLICPDCMHVETVYALEGEEIAVHTDLEQPIPSAGSHGTSVPDALSTGAAN